MAFRRKIDNDVRTFLFKERENRFSVGNVDFSDVEAALDAIERAKRLGTAVEWRSRTVTAWDLHPYGSRVMFFFDFSEGWLRFKVFGCWIVHRRIGGKKGV